MIKKLVLGLLAVVFLVSCVQVGRFESVVSEDISGYIHTIKTEFTSEYLKYDPQDRVVTSTSFHIGGGYVVTAAHCVKFDHVFKYTFFGPVKVPINSYNYKWTIGEDQIELIGTYDDVALLYNKKLIGTPFVRWGDSSKLKPGDAIVNVGNSMMAGINYKDGMVSKIGIDKPLFEMHERTAAATMVVSIPVNGGDSGSPVFAKRNGQHYFVGIIYAGAGGLQGYNFAFMSNYVKMAIEEIRNTAGGKINPEKE
jgi:S1-C subfamily serine protease